MRKRPKKKLREIVVLKRYKRNNKDLKRLCSIENPLLDSSKTGIMYPVSPYVKIVWISC